MRPLESCGIMPTYTRSLQYPWATKHPGRRPMARILVVDDEAEIRAVIRLALEQAGHEVTEAADGSEGLKLFLFHRADLVITDVFMPERDGVEFMRLIRSKVGTTP